MRLVINHLTRMRQGHICVAGLDVKTGQHVRPVVGFDTLTFDHLARGGGPFDLGAVVELTDAKPVPSPPHIEDHRIEIGAVRVCGAADHDRFWSMLMGASKTRLTDLFGPDLKQIAATRYGTDLGKGAASLGCFRPAFRPRLHIDASRPERPQIRMTLRDGDARIEAPVTDIRLFEDDLTTPHAKRVAGVNLRIARSQCVILSMGLSREYPKYPTKDSVPRHWLQVNNIHFKEYPVWQLG